MPCNWNRSDTPLGRNHRLCRPGGAYDLHSPRYEHIGLNFPKDNTTVKFDFSGLKFPSSSSNTTVNFNVNAGYSRPSGWSLFGGFLGNMLGNLLGMGLMGMMMKRFMPSIQAPVEKKVYADTFIPSAGPQKLPTISGASAVQDGGKTEEVKATVTGHGSQTITGAVFDQIPGDDSTDGWPKQFKIADKTNNDVDTNGNVYTFKLVNGDKLKGTSTKPQYKCIQIVARVQNGESLDPTQITYDVDKGVARKGGKIIETNFGMKVTADSPNSPLVHSAPLQGVTEGNSKVQTKTWEEPISNS
mgnify:CR=1 FL=1